MRKWSLLSVLILAFGVTACSDDDDKDCVDADGDGYGVGVDCDQTMIDCDDNNAAVWTEMTGYADADDDGEPSDVAETLCTNGTLPTGYSATAGTDCDDDDADVYQELTGYIDEDMDGEAAATAIAEVVCSGDTLPDNYMDVAGTDCDDTDDTVWAAMNGYTDLDGDGVVGNIPIPFCTDGSNLPMGFQATPGDDCDDTDPFWNDANMDPYGNCDVLGMCLDLEMFMPTPSFDGAGVGACPMGADCNSTNSAVNEPATDNGAACVDETDCNVGEICVMAPGATGKTCHDVDPLCINDPTTGLACSELADTAGTGCLQVCPDLPDDPTPQEVYAYGRCLADCIESATPTAQYLWHVLQLCQADAGCFAPGVDQVTCTTTNCATEYVACAGDLP